LLEKAAALPCSQPGQRSALSPAPGIGSQMVWRYPQAPRGRESRYPRGDWFDDPPP